MTRFLLLVNHLMFKSEHGSAALASETVVLDGVHDVLIPPAVVRDPVPGERGAVERESQAYVSACTRTRKMRAGASGLSGGRGEGERVRSEQAMQNPKCVGI